jgi:uncharacterized membrane protein YdbT with pleckstrin-like domain
MDVSIRPDYREFLSENLGLTFLFFVSLVAMPLLTSVDNNYLQLAVSSLSLLLAVVLIIRYVMLTAVIWIVGESTFCRIRGVFSRHTDYIELYRVVDYSESQTFLQKLWRVKTVSIISTDKSDSTMQMYGVKASLDIVRLIRNRVEKCKQEKRIYEITNQ